ncbi:MAG: CBS domain-containing protein [Planctomycetota bacterium]|jgi:PAS domain S-box-containing protein
MENKNQLSDSVNTAVIDIQSERLITSAQVWLEVKDVMSKDVITVGPKETVVSAAKIMSENNVSCAVVMDRGSLTGILTEKDLLTMIAGKGKKFAKIKVAQIMSSPVDSIDPDLSVLDASGIMETKHIRRLPILEGGQLLGIVTQTDLARALTSYGMWKDVTEIMSSDVAVIQTKATVAEAVEIMKSRSISCIVALKENNVQGIITERDILKGIIALKKDPVHIKIEEVMSSPVIMIPASYSVFSARKVMDKLRVRRLVAMEEGRLCGIVTQTDIFRAVKQKLLEQEEKNSRLLERSKSNIYTLDLDGRITYVNPAFMELLEVTDPEELIGQPFLPERFFDDPEKRAQLLMELKKEKVEVKELALRTSMGRKVYVTLFSTFTKNIHDEINGTQGILYNVTDHKAAEESTTRAYKKLKKTYDELEEAQLQLIQNEKLASIGQLAAGVAHEMNTPVGFVASNFQALESYVKKIRDLLAMYDEIFGQIETLGKTELRNKTKDIGQFRDDKKIDFILEDIQGLFDDSREGLDKITGIVKNLRDFSRIDQPGSRDEYNINKGIEITLVVVKNEIKYDADVKIDFSEVPLIFCHSSQINQVFLNILLNAAQAIRTQERDGNGTITIRTHATETDVVCEIADDGPGIPPDKLSKVFDPFFTTKPAGKGTGLGLNVSYDIIVNKHNGELLIDSKVGEGTKFTIKLPIGSKENNEQEIMSDGKEDSVVCG